MNNFNHKSRLKSHLQKQAYRNVLLAAFGIVLVIILLIIFGTNILVSFSLLIGRLTGTEEVEQTTQSTTYIAPPTLDAPFEATSSATLSLSGFAQADQTIALFRNGKQIAKTSTKDNNSFTFRTVRLDEGENVFKTRVITTDQKHSEYSNEIKIALLNEPPELTVDAPQDGQVFKKDGRPVKVSGKTNPNVKVTVNDFWAIVDDEGNYSYLYTLKDGENELKIVATDNANNKTEKILKIRTE
jgi:hypothetical protein